MNPMLNNFNLKELKGRDARLFQEWKELDALCSKRKQQSPNPFKPSLSYIIRRKNSIGLPTEFEIWYRCKSIVGVEETEPPRKPIFGDLHKMSVVLPNNYPSADGNEMGVLASIKDLVLRVERYLKYQMYHAQNTYPYPEDQGVAEWVREEGEPNGWVKFAQDSAEPASTPPQQSSDNNEEKPRKPKVSLSI